MSQFVLKLFAAIGGLSACAGVALGALSAHALKSKLEAAQLQTLNTVSIYCLVHGLALLVLTTWLQRAPEAFALKIVGALYIAGLCCFCVGLSVSILTGTRVFAAAAPFGGVAFMLAWLGLAGYGIARL